MTGAELRLALDEVNGRFARSLDQRDYPALRELFTPDAKYTSGEHRLVGVDAIVESFENRDVGRRVTRHVCGGLTVSTSTQTNAQSTSVWTCYAAPAPDVAFGVYMVADFTDEWRRDQRGGWRLAARAITPVFRDAALAPTASAQSAPTTPVPRAGPPRAAGEPRTAVPRREDLHGAARELYDTIVDGPRAAQRQVPLTDDQGGLLGPFGLMTMSPEVGARVQELGATLRFRSHLPDRARELLILDVAARTRSEFEWTAHEKAGRSAGLRPEHLQCLLDGQTPADLDAVERSVLALGRSMETGGLNDAEFADVAAALGTQTVADVIWTAGYYTMLAWALAAFRPAADSTVPIGPTDLR